MIYLISGPIQSGKTTALTKWIENRDDIGGFLSPVINDVRTILHITEAKSIPFEVDPVSFGGEKVFVGKYIFDQGSFDQATKWTIDDSEDDTIKYLIIDEIGKLELKDQGFHELLIQLLEAPPLDKHIVIVVRKSLLSQVIQKYNLEAGQIIWGSDPLGEIIEGIV